ncbi:MAG: TonB-dependent receptor [Verrucomicrobia bacterium]|nr:TonB-dependent receptor [Verrucomicrobiota bacterium]
MNTRPLLFASLITVAIGAGLRAQSTPAGVSAGLAARDDQPIVLSEFRVDTSKDRGYVATNATTGTRLNMPIKDIPLPVEVITREFIDDIGAVDIKESLRYSAGIVQDTVTTSNNFTFSPSGTGNAGSISRDSVQINIRGFNTRSFLRNGFRQDTVTDVVNIDRQEVARGPQALLYGVAALGGIVNITPKYPRNTPYTSARVGVGSDEFYRFEAYRSGPVMKRDDGKALNYGIGVVYQTLSYPDEFDDRRRLLITPAIDFRPFRNTNVFVDVEYGKFRAEGIGFKDVSDASAGNVINRFGLRVAENVNEYNEGVNVARNRFGRDRFFRWSGGDTFNKDDYFSGTVEVTQRILPGLSAVVGANYTDVFQQRRSLDSQGVVTSNTTGAVAPTTVGVWTNVGPNPTNPAQTYWKTINYQWAHGATHKFIRQLRAELTADFSLWGNKQLFLLGRQEQTINQTDRSTAQVTSNVTGGTNRSFVAFNDLRPIRYQGEQTRVFREVPFWEWNSGHYATYQGRWWHDRLTTIAGLRWNRYMVRTYNNTFVKADATLPDTNLANWAKPAAPDATSLNSAPGAVPVVNGYRFGGKVQRDTSPTAGVSAKVWRDVALYAVTAGGIFPNTGQRDGAGNPFQAEKTESKEVGLKFDLWKDRRGRDRISATVAAFEIKRENAIYNLFWAPQPRSNNQATLRAGFTGNVPVSGSGPNAYAVTNSAYTTFQTDKPVTYLLPISYVAAADLNHPRVTGAPQLNGFVLVDYASLGAAASDPLRRALDQAANDANNFTALQTATTGTGAAALNANNGYALNRNSDTSYNDQTRGVDLQVYLNLTDQLSAVVTYQYLTQWVLGGFRVADQPSSTEYDSWWNYMGVPLESRRANKDESSYDFSGQTRGRRTLDNPRNQLSLWTKYEFPEGRWRGLDLGLGVQFNGQRQSEVLLTNGARTTEGLENVRYKPKFQADYKVNLGVGYRTTLWGRKWNFRLNVNNLLNEQKKEATGESTLFVDPATGALVASTVAGARRITVPERAVRYYDPISFRLTAGASF